jgi:hypothetical protein
MILELKAELLKYDVGRWKPGPGHEDEPEIFSQEDLVHRQDKPAVVAKDGGHLFVEDGAPHREGGRPAAAVPGGPYLWAEHGQLSRSDGPALQWADGEAHYAQEGLYGRGHLPAVERPDGLRLYASLGRLSREESEEEDPLDDELIHPRIGTKPAVVHPNGLLIYAMIGCLNEIRYPGGPVIEFGCFGEIDSWSLDLPHSTPHRFYRETWELHLLDDSRRLHCDTGPALYRPDGSYEYWQHGRRVEGPAGSHQVTGRERGLPPFSQPRDLWRLWGDRKASLEGESRLACRRA